MSTPHTDSHWEQQDNIRVMFDCMLQDHKRGFVGYDEVVEYLDELAEDSDVDKKTYHWCHNEWTKWLKEKEEWDQEEFIKNKNMHK